MMVISSMSIYDLRLILYVYLRTRQLSCLYLLTWRLLNCWFALMSYWIGLLSTDHFVFIKCRGKGYHRETCWPCQSVFRERIGEGSREGCGHSCSRKGLVSSDSCYAEIRRACIWRFMFSTCRNLLASMIKQWLNLNIEYCFSSNCNSCLGMEWHVMNSSCVYDCLVCAILVFYNAEKG